MKYKYEICTEVLPREGYSEAFEKMISILQNNGITNITMMFGWAWFSIDDDRQWKNFDVQLNQIKVEIKKAEDEDDGPNASRFYHDDVYITIHQPAVEAKFCHEHDIHLSFNEESLIVSEILNVLRNYSSKLQKKDGDGPWKVVS